jgi:hypothetical protein
MADRHPVYVTPPEPENPPTTAEAEATLAAVLPTAWVRKFDQFTDNDGATKYVDRETGVTYDTLPDLHSKDGKDN